LEQAAEYDMTVKQNSGFTLPLRYEAPDGSPVDFTGSTAQMQVRAKIGAPTVLFELSTADGSIVRGADGTGREHSAQHPQTVEGVIRVWHAN
jgi:hypothetical protein